MIITGREEAGKHIAWLYSSFLTCVGAIPASRLDHGTSLFTPPAVVRLELQVILCMPPRSGVTPNSSTGHSMPSPLVTATLQAAGLSALSNVLAQCLRSYRNNEPLRLNAIQLLQFVGFTFLTCPPNFLWQRYLEETFPGKTVHYDGTTSLDKGNTAKKFFIDQTLGAVVNTVIFVGTFAAFKGKDRTAIQREVRRVCGLLVGPYRLLTPIAGDLPSNEKRLEIMACRFFTEFHCGTSASTNSGGKRGWSVLGDRPILTRGQVTHPHEPKSVILSFKTS